MRRVGGQLDQGQKESELKRIPLRPNLQLIYSGLGPYDNIRLGTPCDDN